MPAHASGNDGAATMGSFLTLMVPTLCWVRSVPRWTA